GKTSKRSCVPRSPFICSAGSQTKSGQAQKSNTFLSRRASVSLAPAHITHKPEAQARGPAANTLSIANQSQMAVARQTGPTRDIWLNPRHRPCIALGFHRLIVCVQLRSHKQTSPQPPHNLRKIIDLFNTQPPPQQRLLPVRQPL